MKTIIFKVPDGYNIRHSFYKLKSLDDDYVETRGRPNNYLNPEEDEQATLKEIKRAYNKKYYDKKKQNLLMNKDAVSTTTKV